MLDITVSHDSAVPPYEQIRLAIMEQVRAEELTAGTKIPTVRALAHELRVAPNTVARAYRELESHGILETRGRQGSFIAATGDATRDLATRAAADYAAVIRRLGVDVDSAVEYLRVALRSGGAR